MESNIKINPLPNHMCLGCPGYCCKIDIDLTTYDMIRISIMEKKQIQEFAEAVEVVCGDDPAAFKALGKKAIFQMKHNSGSCMFLNTNKQLKCAIQKSKPAVCLAYPFSLGDKKVLLRKTVLCPPGNKLRADAPNMTEDLLESCCWEWERYLEIVQDWNASAKGNERPYEFLEFAAKEMDTEKSMLGSGFRKLKRFLTHKIMKR